MIAWHDCVARSQLAGGNSSWCPVNWSPGPRTPPGGPQLSSGRFFRPFFLSSAFCGCWMRRRRWRRSLSTAAHPAAGPGCARSQTARPMLRAAGRSTRSPTKTPQCSYEPPRAEGDGAEFQGGDRRSRGLSCIGRHEDVVQAVVALHRHRPHDDTWGHGHRRRVRRERRCLCREGSGSTRQRRCLTARAHLHLVANPQRQHRVN